MKALSIRPPWVYAIFHLGKAVENRGDHALGWRKYRGPLVIHASKTWDQKGYEFLTEYMGEYVPSRELHVFGALQGIVNFTGIITSREELETPEDRRWFSGDVGLVFEDPREFKTPIPWRGQLGIFDVPDHILKK